MRKQAWVYILKCVDGSYYTGHTHYLAQRVMEHQQGMGSNWTKARRPVQLVFSQEMPDKDSAFQAERRIKGWSRAKKKALIAQDWDLLQKLAENRQDQNQSDNQNVAS